MTAKPDPKSPDPKTLIRWSIFGQGSVILSFGIRVEPALLVIDRVMETFAEAGAVITRRDSSSFECTLPVRKFLGITYRRGVTIPCRVEIDSEAQWSKPNVIIRCDVENIRSAKRAEFYILSLLCFVIVFGNVWTGNRDVTTWLFLGLPWAIVEINFFAHRLLLRDKLLKLVRAAGRGR